MEGGSGSQLYVFCLVEGGSGSYLYACCIKCSMVVLVSCVGVCDSVQDGGW